MKKCCLLIFPCLLFVFALTGCYEPKNDTPYSASDMESEWQGGYDAGKITGYDDGYADGYYAGYYAASNGLGYDEGYDGVEAFQNAPVITPTE